MKIAMIGQKGIPAQYGGVETHVERLSQNLAERDFDVSVYCRRWYSENESDENQEKHSSIRQIYSPSIKTKRLDTITHTLTSTIHALTQDYDIIHYHGVGPSLFSWIPRIFSNSKVISTFHCIDRKHGKWGILGKTVLRIGEWASCNFPHETISVSKGIKNYAYKAYDTATKHIPNGTPLYTKNTETNQIEKWNLNSKEYILVVSRLISHKGVHYVIEAFKKLKNQFPKLMEEKKLVIVGSARYDDKYTEKIKNMAKSKNDIILTGFQTEESLEQLFSNAKLMISASENEGLPITILEGMSYKLPVILSDIPEHKELIDNPEYLFENKNIQDLQETLKKTLKQNKKDLNKQAERNRKKIEQEYSWDSITEEIIDLYKETKK
ncbi:MAG: glycosyltransferase family 4 protein [Candidatus Magasanikbacteria bacterium]